MGKLIKMSLMLLLRNKGFWFFLITMPLLSIYVLSINGADADLAYFREDETREVKEISGPEQKVAYYGKTGEFVIKAYDASGSELSDMFLNMLAGNGMFLVCRVKTPELSLEDVEARMERDGFEDRMGVALYLPKDFDERVLGEDAGGAMTVFVLSEDERLSLFERECKGFLSEARDAARLTGKEGSGLAAELKNFHGEDPVREIRSLAKKGAVDLTRQQVNQKAQMGYAFSFLTLCFVFCGVIVAHTAIEEEKHKVLTRIRLSGLSDLSYFTAKFVVSVIVSVMITGVLGVLTLFLDKDQLGMGRASFLLLVFLMGIIFSSLSLLLGMLSGEVMSANFAAFTLWSLSSLLAGLYFPLDDASKMVRTISYVMPQRWFMDNLNSIFVGDKRGYVMVLCITVAYLIIILSLGGMGLKMKKTEQ